MTLVFDATPLIYLGKVESLDLLSNVEKELVVPTRVCDEVIYEGMKYGYADAERVNKHLRDGLLEQRNFEKTERFERLVRNTDPSPADVTVLLLADEADGVAVMDEQHGRNVADVEDIETRGTAYLLLLLVKNDDISAENARDTIDAMLDAGWHCAPDLYAKVLRKLDELAAE